MPVHPENPDQKKSVTQCFHDLAYSFFVALPKFRKRLGKVIKRLGKVMGQPTDLAQ